MMRLAALFTASVAIGSAQFLYNERLDKKSQDALTAAKAVSSGAVFEKELQNLDRLWKFSSARVFQGAELQMSADLSGFFDWRQVAGVIERTRKQIGKAQELSETEKAQFVKDKATLATDKQAATTALKELKDSAAVVGKDFPQIGEWLGRIGQLDTLEEYARQVGIADPTATDQALVAELSTTFKSLAALYKDFKLALPASPQLLLLQSQLEFVKAGEQHLVRLGLIRTRLELDLRELDDLVTNGEAIRRCVIEGVSPSAAVAAAEAGCVAVTSNDVASTLEISVQAYRDARQRFQASQSPADEAAQLRAKKRLDAQLSLLAVGAAVAARGGTALRLALLREADEGQQYAIRQSALSARSYEQLLLNGAQRLSLYHQGGIRPDTLARILNAAGTLGLIPTLLSK